MAGRYRCITSKKRVPLLCLILLFSIILASCEPSEPKVEELTKEFLIGTWVWVDMEQDEDPRYQRFTANGDYIWGDSQSNPEYPLLIGTVTPEESTFFRGTYTLNGSDLTIEVDENSPACAGGFWKYQLEITQSGDLIFDTTSYECPEGLTHVVPWTYSRVSD